MTGAAAPTRPRPQASRGRAFVCPGCARPLRDEHVEATEGYARCAACSAVFVVPSAAFGARYATARPAQRSDLRVQITEKRAHAAGYRSSHRELVDQRELRLVYTPGRPVNNVAMAVIMAVAAGITAFATSASRDPNTAGKLAVLAGLWLVVGLFFVERALVGRRAHALVEIRDGRMIVDRARTHATIDVEGVHVSRRMVPMREAAAVFGKLSDRNAETTALFDLVARVGGRAEVLATFATADHAILAEAAVSGALGLDGRAGSELRVDAAPARSAEDASDEVERDETSAAEAEDVRPQRRSL